MSKSFKFTENTYLDSVSVSYSQKSLEDYLNAKGKTLRCGITSNQSISANTLTQINFNRLLNNNFNNDYNNYFKLSDGKIEIMNSNINSVIVVASVQTSGMGSSNIYITHSSKGRFAVTTCSSSENGVAATAAIPVSKGDKIYVEFYSGTAGQINTWTDMTFIEIVSL